MHIDMYEELMYSTLLILEPFINAKTITNESSCRAVKNFSFIIEKKTLSIKSISIAVDFLEKTRVSFKNPNESNFMIFYMIIEFFPENLKKDLKLKKSTNIYEILKINDAKAPNFNKNKDYYKLIEDSFQILGFNQEEIHSIYKILSAIIHLGEPISEENSKIIQELLEISTNSLDIILKNKQYFGIWLYSKLLKWIVKKINMVFLAQINTSTPISENMLWVKKIYEENYKNSYINPPSNVNNSNMMSTFTGLNKNDNNNSCFISNSSVNTPKHNNNNNLNTNTSNSCNYGFLHLIDFFGVKPKSTKSDNFLGFFEFKVNYFYEKIHQIYLKETFKDEEVNFLQEGLIKNCEFIDFKDNLPIIELIEKPTHGLFEFFKKSIEMNNFKYDEKMLEDIMARDGNDIFFTGKMTKKTHSFVIIHSFNEIYYSIDDIFEDLRREAVIDSMKKTWFIELTSLNSSNKLIPLILKPNKTKITSSYTANFIQRFQMKAENLMNSLSFCEKRIVFCIDVEKNCENLVNKLKFNSIFCLYQSQIFELNNLIIRYKDEFLYKIDYLKFYQDFKELLGTSTEIFMKEKVLDHKLLCEKIIQSNFAEYLNSRILLGKTKIYLKSEIYQKLESKKTLILSKKNSLKSDKFFSSPQFKVTLKLSIHGLKQVIKVIIEFQKRFRAKCLRKKFLRKKKALTLIENYCVQSTVKEFFKKYRIQVKNMVLKNQKLKKLIKLIQISKNSLLREYFLRYLQTVQFEKAYSFKKDNDNFNIKSPIKHKPTKTIQSDAILKQLEREKSVDFKKKNSIISATPLISTEMSLGKLLKNKLMKSLENKSIFERFTKKKTDNSYKSSSFIDESMSLDCLANPPLEEIKAISSSSTSNNIKESISEYNELEDMLESGNFEQKRRKCVIAKSFLEYENRSTKSLLEEYLEYKFKKEPVLVEFEQLPMSNDVYLDFESLDQRFIEELRKEYFEETWKKIIIERTIWGSKQKYAKLMSFQGKLMDHPLLDLPSKYKDLAKLMFKYILQYSDDRKTKFPKSTQLNKLINIILFENNCSFLQDEIYLQIIKQLSNNPSPKSTKQLLNLLAIISSIIPPSSNILMSVLNFLYIKASLNVEFNEEFAMKCKYIFVRISKTFEIGGRKNIPMDMELSCIEHTKQILYQIYFLTGEHVLIGCESYTLIKELKDSILNRFKLTSNRGNYLGIFYTVHVEKDNILTLDDGFLDDKTKIMDILAKWDSFKKNNMKTGFSFISRIYIRIRASFDYEANHSNDDITLVYIQSVYEFLNDRYAVNEKDILNLASTKMAVDYGDFSEEKVRFLKINIQDYIPKSRLEVYQPQIWIDRILVNYLQLKTYSKTQAKQLFLSYLKKFESFNAQVYKAKLIISEEILQNCIENSENNEKLLIWKIDGLLIGEDEKKIEEKIKYKEIIKWGRIGKKGVYLSKENDQKRVFNVFSEKYKDLEFLLRFYANK